MFRGAILHRGPGGQTRSIPSCSLPIAPEFGAGGGNRTHTRLPERDFESRAFLRQHFQARVNQAVASTYDYVTLRCLRDISTPQLIARQLTPDSGFSYYARTALGERL
jgi:hypothetical protein